MFFLPKVFAFLRFVKKACEAIILDTLKGRGVKQVEETTNNHSMTMGPDVFQAWISELKDKLDELTAEEV